MQVSLTLKTLLAFPVQVAAQAAPVVTVPTRIPRITSTTETQLTLTQGSAYVDPAWVWGDDVVSDQPVKWYGQVVNTSKPGPYVRMAVARNAVGWVSKALTIIVKEPSAMIDVHDNVYLEILGDPVVYRGFDNVLMFRLRAEVDGRWRPVDLTAVTGFRLEVPSEGLVVTTGFALETPLGEFSLNLGQTTLTPGEYYARMVVFDLDHVNGQVIAHEAERSLMLKVV